MDIETVANSGLEQETRSNVTPFQPVTIRKREPQLSDAELIRIRRMLWEHEAISATCPLAKKIIHGG